MLKTLIKKQIYEVWKGYFYDSKKNRARSTAKTVLLFILFAVLMCGVIGGMFFYVSLAVCGSLITAGLPWLFYILMGLISLVLGVFGSVFNTYASLYKSKDNELLLSMPIRERDIILSRLVNVYLLGLMYSAVVLLPAILVRIILGGFSLLALGSGLLLLLMISVIDLILSCLCGWAVAKISGKIKNKGIVSALCGVCFIAIYYYLYFNAIDIITDIVLHADAFAGGLSGAGRILYEFGRIGSGEASILVVLLFVAVLLVLSVLTYLILQKSFLPIATAADTTKKKQYTVEKPMEQQSISRALLRREQSHFFSSATYLLNCGMGIILMPVAAIAVAVKGGFLREMLGAIAGDMPIIVEIMPLLIITTIGLIVSLDEISTPSIALEGKTLWILKSLPVSAWEILHAKERLHIRMNGIPAVISILIIDLSLGIGFENTILSAVVIFLFVCFMADVGLVCGLQKPNLNWTSETAPIKQNLYVLAAMLAGSVVSIAMTLVACVLHSYLEVQSCMMIWLVVLVLLTRLLRTWLMKAGPEKFNNL